MKKISILVYLFSTLCAYSQCWQQLDTGHSYTVGIRDDNTLWGWGENGSGQLGIGSTSSSVINQTPIGIDNDWAAVSAGGFHTVALKTDGTIWAFGKNVSGQLGNGSTTDSHIPIQVGTDNDWIYIYCGAASTFAIKSNGTLWAWGSNGAGSLGLGTYDQNVTIPTQIGNDTDWKRVYSGTGTTFAIKENGTLWACGHNSNGELGIGSNLYFNVMVQVGDDMDWNIIAADVVSTYGIKTDGSLWAWGDNPLGQLGFETFGVNVPTQVDNNHWLHISSDGETAHGIKQDGSLWGWGNNMFGNVGDGTTVNRFVPTLIDSGNWSRVYSGQFHYMAVDTNNSIFAWGSSMNGQFGNGTTTTYDNPVLTPTLVMTCATAGVTSAVQDSFSIYPNPAEEVLNVITSLTAGPATFSIYNTAGVKVMEQAFAPIYVGHLESGIYLLRISSADTSQVVKFIKQ